MKCIQYAICGKQSINLILNLISLNKTTSVAGRNE